ncbi:MAG: response regulator, partial [Campylobacterales bacterium]|nr:response regulator [Campylobacterales bacterium]
LYVDDSRVVRDMMESILLELGYLNIEGAVDGVDALEKIDQADQEFDFVITDINMPNMDGITFIQRLRSKLDYASTPIMVLSTEWSSAMKQKGKDAGATSWIVKPFDLQLINKGISMTIQKVNAEE